ncbi:MAG: RecX family transcriptional regulator, partial [Parachlamydiaceae bacterium]|nr:RecX family transcriptional regulator [Parachlamydiaceae bacterium]
MFNGLKVEVSPHNDRRSLLVIYLDEDPWRTIHTSIFGLRPSLPKDCSSIEQFAEKFAAIEYQRAKYYTIKRLSLLSLPSAKLIKSLKERLISELTISRVINELVEAGYINDPEWVKSFVRVQAQRKMGPRA